MKARPTREQNKYLSVVLSIPEESLPIPLEEDPVISTAEKGKKKNRKPALKRIISTRTTPVPASNFPVSVIIILVIVALLVMLVRGVHGADEKSPVAAKNIIHVISHGSNASTKTLAIVSNTLISTKNAYITSNLSSSVSNTDNEVKSSGIFRRYENVLREDESLWGLFAIVVILGLVVGVWLLDGLDKIKLGKQQDDNGVNLKDVKKTSFSSKIEVIESAPASCDPEIQFEKPEKILRDLVERKDPSFLPDVSIPSRFWDLTVTTHTGNVRTRNEDSGIAFSCLGIQFLIIADGLGGMKHGQIASNSAVSEAILSIVSDMMRFRVLHGTDVLAIIEKAMYRAAIRLSEEAAKLGHPQEGLRTTLIIIAGGIDYYAYTYIGDGGGIILRSDGSSEQFLNPQKADARFANILAASLGPCIEGKPCTGTAKRFPGDLLITGTDGVFDFVVSDFSNEVARTVFELNGDLQQSAEKIVGILAGEKDEKGWLCSDNLTLGLMANAPISPLMFSQLNTVCGATTSTATTAGNKEN